MRVKISKLGRDVAVRLSREMAEQHGIIPGLELDVVRSPTQVRLALEEPNFTLESLIAECKTFFDNGGAPPELMDWDPDVGSERFDNLPCSGRCVSRVSRSGRLTVRFGSSVDLEWFPCEC